MQPSSYKKERTYYSGSQQYEEDYNQLGDSKDYPQIKDSDESPEVKHEDGHRQIFYSGGSRGEEDK